MKIYSKDVNRILFSLKTKTDYEFAKKLLHFKEVYCNITNVQFAFAEMAELV